MNARADPDQLPPRPLLRADMVLLGVLAVAAILAFVLVAMLWTQNASGRSELGIVTNVRSARAEIFGATLAQREVEILAAEYRGDHPMESRAHLLASHEEAHRHLHRARSYMGSDPAVASALDQFDTLIDARFEEIEGEIAHRRSARDAARSEEVLRTAEALHALLNSRIDESRRNEQAADTRVAQIAGVLLALTVVTALLGFVALRRWQYQWRIADTAAVQARESARAADIAKSRFLAVASHDMRQPLHALTLYLGALGRRIQGDEARDILGKMERAVQSMSGMFAALVDLARMQAGVIAPDICETALDDIVERAAAAHPGMSIPALLPAVNVRTDPVLLGQILSHLMANAVQHGGGAARITAQQSGERVEIVIADDGPGIPEEDQGRIFEEFERLDKHSGGLGLGLTIVRHLARLLDISLKLDSAPGQGARFILGVPLAGPAAIENMPGPANADDARGVQVLVLDDDDLARGAMVSALLDLGADVRGFANEHDFNGALSDGATPRLLIMDLRIDGDLSGLRIANEAVARSASPPRVIVVTGDTEASTLGELKQSGYAVLIKPVTGEALRQAALHELSPP